MITVSLEIYSTTKFPQPINFPYCHKTLRTITIASYIIPHKAFQKRTFLSDNTNRYLNLHPLPQPHKTIRSTFQRNLTPQFDFSDRVHTHTHTYTPPLENKINRSEFTLARTESVEAHPPRQMLVNPTSSR